ncbi:hypothetical protein GCM10010403_43340 [Glycomyces rutgersensis]|uniref:Uncharacterized protein n=1 Tax=Glycomyces rutgersensis TaxID=58115 RepID=A0ABP5T452_9ACTN
MRPANRCAPDPSVTVDSVLPPGPVSVTVTPPTGSPQAVAVPATSGRWVSRKSCPVMGVVWAGATVTGRSSTPS